MPHVDIGRARLAMDVSYRAVTGAVGRLDDADLARPSRCQGWSRADLLFHLLLDAQRVLAAQFPVLG